MNIYITEPGISFHIGPKGKISSSHDKSVLEKIINNNRGRGVLAINENESCVISLRLNLHREIIVDYLPMSRKTIWSMMRSKEQAKSDAMDASRNSPKEYARKAGYKPGTVNYHSYLIEFDKTFRQTTETRTITF